MSQPPQPPYSGQPYNGQPSSGQPYQGGQYGGQQYPGQQPPYSGQPNPDVPTSVPPSYPPTTAYPSSGQPQSGQPGEYGTPQYGQPQSGQPGEYGTPQYGQPQSGQPGEYGTPQYGQQPYGQSYGQYGTQPDYAQQGYGQPGFPPATPPKKSKALPIILTVIGIVLVLCIGGSVAIFLVAKNKADDINGQITSGNQTPTTSTTQGTTEPTQKASTIKIVEPKTLGGRPKLTDAQFADVADELQSSLKAVPGATNSVGALYGTVAKQDIVIVAAAEAPISDPATELSQTFYGAGIGGLKIENITSAPTGALGGAAKCGSAEASGVDMAICSWADDGSLGMMIWYFKSVSKAKAEFPKLRAQVETKS